MDGVANLLGKDRSKTALTAYSMYWTSAKSKVMVIYPSSAGKMEAGDSLKSHKHQGTYGLKEQGSRKR